MEGKIKKNKPNLNDGNLYIVVCVYLSIYNIIIYIYVTLYNLLKYNGEWREHYWIRKPHFLVPGTITEALQTIA